MQFEVEETAKIWVFIIDDNFNLGATVLEPRAPISIMFVTMWGS